MLQATRCPDLLMLRQHLQQALTGDAERNLIDHLDHCENCQKNLQWLAAGDTNLIRAAQQVGDEPSESNVQLRALIETLAAQGSRPTISWTTENMMPALAPPEKPGELGRLGHYAVLDVIGRGGMGIVLKAFDQRLQRVVAVKVLAPQLAASVASRARFLREARAAAAIRHDNVINIYAVEELAEPPYLVMEHIAGESLQERLKRTGPVDATEIARIGMQIALGLAAAHAAGVIHRDIKPANVLLERGLERVKLTDFGLACAADEAGLAPGGVIAGTPHYMAPEQARGEAVDHRADLYSLGSVLYVLATGHEPFGGFDTMSVVRGVQSGRPRPARELNPQIPNWLDAIITKLHAVKPEERFASAAEVAEALGRHLAPTPPLAESAPRGSKSKTAWLLAGTLAVGMCVVGSSLWSGLLPWSDEKKADVELAHTKIWPPKVLIVLPSKDFFYPDYNTVRSQLSNAGAKCVVAAPTLDDVTPLGDNPKHEPVTPDIRLADANAADYSAVYFGGGVGVEEYFASGPHAKEAKRLIKEAIGAKRLVTALGMGPRILAEAGELKDVRATCYQHDQPPGFHVKSLERAGAIFVDAPVVRDGLFITGRNPSDTFKFTQELRKQLGVP